MKNKKTKIGAFAIGLAMLVVFGAGAVTSDETVTVTWIIPSDTSFSIAWAGGESKIVFDTGAQNFTGIAARSQTGATPIINITNTGNTAVNYHMYFNASLFPAGITYVNCSVYNDTNTTLFYWTNDNETNNQTVASAIAIDGYADFWFFSDGIEVAESAEGEDITGLEIVAINA